MNGNKPWVKACGRATEAELEALVQQNLMDGFWAAFYTDRFAAGRTADGVPLPTPETYWSCVCLVRQGSSGSAAAAWARHSVGGWPLMRVTT